jgi:predicted nucleotidyltransferase
VEHWRFFQIYWRAGDANMTAQRTAPVFEGFALQTTDDLVFTVKGLVHPPDRVIAYLRYLPDSQGNRERDGVHYRRVYHFEEQLEILEARYPVYLRHDPVFGICLQSVPRRLIQTIYDPRRFLATLRETGPADLVEESALGLAYVLQEAAMVPWQNLGVSGSLLVGMQNEDSDLDLVIYGEAAGRAVHRALLYLLDNRAAPVRRSSREELATLHAAHRPDTPLSFPDFVRLQARKVNEGYFRDRPYFIRFVKQPAEVAEQYGSRRFELLGSATIRARVTDDHDTIFTPCHYAVAEVTFLDGPPVADLQEIASFRGRFSEQVRAGEWAVARGSLERVIPRVGSESSAYSRLVVGGRAGDYLLAESSSSTGNISCSR